MLHARANVRLEDGEIRFDHALDSATLVVTIEMFDDVSKRLFTVDVKFTWEAVDDPVSLAARERSTEPGKIKILGRPVLRTLRSARASGTVIDGERNYTPEPATDATIGLVETFEP